MDEPRQDSLADQLLDLIELATRRGMYDAATWIQDRIERPPLSETFEKLSEASGGRWDGVDADEYVRKLRADD